MFISLSLCLAHIYFHHNRLNMSNITISPLTGGYIYEYRGASTVIIASVFIALQISFACLRAYSGSLQRAGLGADDVLLWASLVVCVALDVYCIGMALFT